MDKAILALLNTHFKRADGKDLAHQYKTTTLILLQTPHKSSEKQSVILILGHYPNLYSTDLIISLSITKPRSTLGISICTWFLNFYLASLPSFFSQDYDDFLTPLPQLGV